MSNLVCQPTWLLIINYSSWVLSAIFIIIALVEVVGQIAIKEKIFTKNIKTIILVMTILVLIGITSTALLHYYTAQSSLDCI